MENFWFWLIILISAIPALIVGIFILAIAVYLFIASWPFVIGVALIAFAGWSPWIIVPVAIILELAWAAFLSNL